MHCMVTVLPEPDGPKNTALRQPSGNAKRAVSRKGAGPRATCLMMSTESISANAI